MKILLIGGTRFIGRHVISQLLQEGHQITLFNRGKTPNPFEGAVKVIKGDRKISGELALLTKGQSFEAVIDMIAYNGTDTEECIKAFAGRINHFIMISTRSVYRQPIKSPIHEGDLLVNDPELSYGFHKVQAENNLLQAYAANSFPATILRLPAVYGEYDYQAREWYFIKRILDKRKQILLPDYGWGINQREYTGNIAAQISILLANRNKTLGQAYNSGHSHFNRYQDLVQIAAEIMNHELKYYGVGRELMPWKIPLASEGVRTCSTGKLESLGYIEPFGVAAGLDRIIKYFTDNPLSEYLFATRQQQDMFNYSLEDRLIAERGILLAKN